VNHPKERIQHSQQGENLKSRIVVCCLQPQKLALGSTHPPVLRDSWVFPGDKAVEVENEGNFLPIPSVPSVACCGVSFIFNFTVCNNYFARCTFQYKITFALLRLDDLIQSEKFTSCMSVVNF
jgi:hypothetical protein